MCYLVLLILVFMFGKYNCVSDGVNFIQGPNDVSLNCIDVASRSMTDCALTASHMEHYENRFAYRSGKCHVCRADNENCVISEDEYKVTGPHFVKGRRLAILRQLGIVIRTLHDVPHKWTTNFKFNDSKLTSDHEFLL